MLLLYRALMFLVFWRLIRVFVFVMGVFYNIWVAFSSREVHKFSLHVQLCTLQPTENLLGNTD